MLTQELTDALKKIVRDLYEEKHLDSNDLVPYSSNKEFFKITDVSIGEGERKYMSKFATDETFLTVIDKLIYAAQLSCSSANDMTALNQMVGGANILKTFKQLILSSAQAMKVDPGTGKAPGKKSKKKSA